MRKIPVIAGLVFLAAGCVRLTPDYLRGTDYGRALMLYQDGRLFQARQVAENVAPEDPASEAAERLLMEIDSVMLKVSNRHMELGEDYEAAGVLRLALKEYRSALLYNPENTLLVKKVKNLEKVISTVDLKDVEKIIKKRAAENTRKGKKVVRKRKRIKTKNGEISNDDIEELANNHYMKGKLYLESGAVAKSIAEFEKVLTIVPTYMDTTLLLGQARESLDKAVDLHLKRGIAYFQKEEIALAIKEWDAALALDPENTVAADYKARAEAILERLRRIRERQSR